MKTFVIGDIHGGFKALISLIENTPLSKDDKLIFLGDYVDGWSESAEVVSFLIKLQQKFSCIFLKGNHDEFCRKWLNNEKFDNYEYAHWLKHGGQATVKSYQNVDIDEKLSHLTFFEKLQNYHIDDNNRLFVHAGFTSMRGVLDETYERSYFWDRTLWELAYSIYSPNNCYHQPLRLKNYSEIFLGHTPTTDYNIFTPITALNVTNLDTGAGYNGKITLMNVDTKEYWQSSFVQDYYKNEKGRTF